VLAELCLPYLNTDTFSVLKHVRGFPRHAHLIGLAVTQVAALHTSRR
jgi:hypothetical protein